MQLLTLKEILPQKAEPYYQSEDAFLLHGDAFGLLKNKDGKHRDDLC